MKHSLKLSSTLNINVTGVFLILTAISATTKHTFYRTLYVEWWTFCIHFAHELKHHLRNETSKDAGTHSLPLSFFLPLSFGPSECNFSTVFFVTNAISIGQHFMTVQNDCNLSITPFRKENRWEKRYCMKSRALLSRDADIYMNISILPKPMCFTS